MLLTGNPGTGKSTLVKSWIASLAPKRFLLLLITQSSLSAATGVLEVLLAKLGERSRFKRSTKLLLLEKHLAELALRHLFASSARIRKPAVLSCVVQILMRAGRAGFRTTFQLGCGCWLRDAQSVLLIATEG